MTEIAQPYSNLAGRWKAIYEVHSVRVSWRSSVQLDDALADCWEPIGAQQIGDETLWFLRRQHWIDNEEATSEEVARA